MKPAVEEGTERLLLARLRNGDTGAFRTFYEAHKTAVFNVCLRLVGRREEAEDLTQETFDLAPPGSISRILMGAAVEPPSQ